MASRRNRTIDMPAPYLRRIWLEPSRIEDRAAYPFCLPFLRDDFELGFDRSITIIVGENGTGKRVSFRSQDISTRLPATLAIAGQTSYPIRMAKVFCGSSKSAANGRASSSSTNRNPHCRPRARWSS